VELSQTPAIEFGDPIVRRRDGAFAYQLVVVVDDADAGVNRVVRGRDIAPSTATQVLLQRLLGAPTPAYRHHFLLLEPRHTLGGDDRKLAKLHGSIGYHALRARYRGDELCGVLAHAAGLASDEGPRRPADLVAGFDWRRVPVHDKVARWSDGLEIDA
jgi:glutamyl-Q tRNA(Asp) synthetase